MPRGRGVSDHGRGTSDQLQVRARTPGHCWTGTLNGHPPLKAPCKSTPHSSMQAKDRPRGCCSPRSGTSLRAARCRRPLLTGRFSGRLGPESSLPHTRCSRVAVSPQNAAARHTPHLVCFKSAPLQPSAVATAYITAARRGKPGLQGASSAQRSHCEQQTRAERWSAHEHHHRLCTGLRVACRHDVARSCPP